VADRPSRLWKTLAPETRQAAAVAFWRDDSADDVPLQHAEAIVAIAKRMNFRPKSVRALPEERRARLLAQMIDVPDAVATRALIAYHFQTQRPMMSAFLEALGIAHDQGLITTETVAPPTREALRRAAGRLRETFAEPEIRLYFQTLQALDGETWANLDDFSGPAGAPGV